MREGDSAGPTPPRTGTWWLLAVGGAVVGLVCWLLFSAAPRERARFIERARAQGEAMADDRAAAVDQWLESGLAGARVMASYPTVIHWAAPEAGAPTMPGVGPREHLNALLADALGIHGYRSVAVVGADGSPVGSAPANVAIEPACAELARRCLAAGAALVDVHLHGDATPAVVFAAPVLRKAGGSAVTGVVVLEVDPNRWLYPFLAHHPEVSETGETVLLERDGGDALFITPLRHEPAPPLTRRQALDIPGFGGAAALGGETAYARYVDYRGAAVFAAPRPLRHAPWGLVVKIDEAEVLGAYRRWLAGAVALVGSLGLALAVLAVGLWRRQRVRLEVARARAEARFALLLEHAGEAVLFIERDGTVREANARAHELYGYERPALRGHSIAELSAPSARDEIAAVLRDARPGQSHNLETINVRRDGTEFPAEMSSRLVALDGDEVFLAIVRDVTGRRQADAERDITMRLLRLLNSSDDLHDLMCEVTLLLRDWLGCEAVGIRLRDGDDYPYFETRGFPAEFVRAESSLCLRDPSGGPIRDPGGHPVLDCMCGNVLRGRFSPAKPFFTARGSFWSNCTTELLATTTDADRQARTRNRCNGEGYESVALVALRVGDEAHGLIQVNDRRRDRFTPERIALLERLADNLAVAIAHRRAQVELATSESRYRFLFTNMLEGYAHCRMLYERGVARDFVYLDVNEAFETLTGLAGVVGRKVTEVIPGIRESNPELFEVYGRVAATGEPERFETFVAPLDMWFSISVYSPASEHFVAVFDVVTERKRAEEALRIAHRQLRQFVDANIVGIVIASATGEVVEANDYYLDLIGFTRGELERGEVDWRAITPPEWLPADEKAIAELRERSVCTPYEKEYVRRDGSRVAVYLADAILAGPEERIAAFAVDISERKWLERELRRVNEELEERVAERTAELEGANRELEAFSYSVSHDLRAPLRAIDGFSRMLVEDYETRLDAEGRRLTGVIRDNAQRMSQLIEDLLAFSRLGRAELHLTRVDMKALAGAVFHDLFDEEERARVDFTVDDIPAARGDPALLRQVWANLLANAVKFSSKRDRAAIRVSGRSEGGTVVYRVSDNGAGFDPRYADKLFGVFQRLHGINEFPGTGVGLALVRRIVSRHGGTTGAEGDLGAGATFSFTLPAVPEEPR